MCKPEKVIEREILIYLNRLEGSFFWKNDTIGIYDTAKGSYRKSPNPFSIRGVADIIGILKGKVYFFEVKTKEGRLSKYQDHFLKKIKELGGNAFVVRSVADVEKLLEELI